MSTSTTDKAAAPATPTNGATPDAPTTSSIADLVARIKPTPQKHYMKTTGEYAWFVPLDAGRRRELDRLQVKEKATFNPETGKDDIEYVYDPVGHQLSMVMLGWTNEKGDRLSGQAGIDLVSQLPQPVVEEAYEIIAKISGYGRAEKNSAASRGGGGS